MLDYLRRENKVNEVWVIRWDFLIENYWLIIGRESADQRMLGIPISLDCKFLLKIITMAFSQYHSLGWCGIMQNGSTLGYETNSSWSEKLMVDPRPKWL